jgi:RimJ/RimL family protein N-acetyltransferase
MTRRPHTAAWPAPLAPVLDGRVVHLEPLAPGHERPLFDAAQPHEVWTWVHHHPAATLDQWQTWFAGALDASASGDEVAFATLDARTGAPIGVLRFLALRPVDRGLEIGSVWLTPTAWHTGAFAEACMLLMGYAFERLGCIRVEYKTHAANARARGALLGLGATFEGIHRKHRIVPGVGLRDSAWYSVIDDEWPLVEAHLRERVEELAGLPPVEAPDAAAG